jgi:hypothetical protein
MQAYLLHFLSFYIILIFTTTFKADPFCMYNHYLSRILKKDFLVGIIIPIYTVLITFCINSIRNVKLAALYILKYRK